MMMRRSMRGESMTDLRQRIFVAFDTETTGLVPQNSNVVEIAGVRFAGDGVEISRFSTLANPGCAIDPKVTKIHGIDDTMVARAPSSSEACRQFASWLGEDDILIAHNAVFDVAFISAELQRGRMRPPRNIVLDTRLGAKHLRPEIDDFRLEALVRHFCLSQTGYHRAMADSLHVRDLFLALVKHQPESECAEWERFAGVATFSEISAGAPQLHPRFAHLRREIEQGSVLSMRYDDDERGVTDRKILPINICHVNEREHLVAQCLTDGGVKQFRLDKIVDVGLPRAGETRSRSRSRA